MHIQSIQPLIPLNPCQSLCLDDQLVQAVQNIDFEKATQLIREGANPLQEIEINFDLYAHLLLSSSKSFVDFSNLSPFGFCSECSECDSADAQLTLFKTSLDHVKSYLSSNRLDVLNEDEKGILEEFEKLLEKTGKANLISIAIWSNKNDLLEAIVEKGYDFSSCFSQMLDNDKKPYKNFSNYINSHYAIYDGPLLFISLIDERRFDLLSRFGVLSAISDAPSSIAYSVLDISRNIPLVFQKDGFPKHLVDSIILSGLGEAYERGSKDFFDIAFMSRSEEMIEFLKKEKNDFLQMSIENIKESISLDEDFEELSPLMEEYLKIIQNRLNWLEALVA